MPEIRHNMDIDTDRVPVRDANSRKRAKMIAEDADPLAQREAHTRATVSKWTREDLEDKYLRMYEENIVLKKHARKQEDKIKRMATKLLRLVSDKKKTEHSDKGSGGHKGRDIETEEMLEDLHGKIRELEKHNAQLKDKLMVTKQQLTITGTRHTPYPNAQSRINTGIAKHHHSDARVTKNIRVQGPSPGLTGTARAHSPTLPRYGHSLLEDARFEIRKQERTIEELNEQINIYEQDVEFVKEQMRMREAEFEEDLLKIKQQATAGQRATVQENVDMIRLQREVKEKSMKLTSLTTKYQHMEDKLHTMKTSHDQLLMEMEHLNHQLNQEQNRVLTLQNELKAGSATQRKIYELEEQVESFKRDNAVLTEANEKLVTSAFDLERERDWRQRENALKVQIAQLEATLKADVGEKGGIIDKYAEERDARDKAEKELSEKQIQFYELKEEHDELKEKMKFFTKESAVDFTEIEETLVLVKQKKEKGEQELDFLQKVDGETRKDYQKQLTMLQAEYAETINELEKTRNMLIVQHNINKDYQIEVESVSRKMDEIKLEYETKLDEYAKLLDIRAARIKKLEAQLKDIAYGTRQYRITEDDDAMSDTEEFDETVHLERGQNLFEIHINKMMLSDEGLRAMGDEEPAVFCTWEFYEFEIQATTVMKSGRPEFDFTSQYIVKVDDFFLHYLQKETTTVELHHAFGTDYTTVAVCQLQFKDIFDKTHGRVHGVAQLIGTDSGTVGLNYGSVEYWIRLRVPMDQALRLYKERTKALGYITSNLKATDQALQALDETARGRPTDNVNEMHVKLIRCTGVKARREGTQPSPYAVYRFFDYPDHDTTIVQNSNNPEFNDHKSYPIPMTVDLDKYLKGQSLMVYVFDDTDPEEAAYLGVATVPLLPLAHDKTVKGTFELRQADGSVNGSVDVQLKWQYSYMPPKTSTKTAAQLLASGPAEKPGHPVLMPGEDLSKSPDAQATSFALPAPQAASTPMKSMAKAKARPQEMRVTFPPPSLEQPKEGPVQPIEEYISPAQAAQAASEVQEEYVTEMRLEKKKPTITLTESSKDGLTVTYGEPEFGQPQRPVPKPRTVAAPQPEVEEEDVTKAKGTIAAAIRKKREAKAAREEAAKASLEEQEPEASFDASVTPEDTESALYSDIVKGSSTADSHPEPEVEDEDNVDGGEKSDKKKGKFSLKGIFGKGKKEKEEKKKEKKKKEEPVKEITPPVVRVEDDDEDTEIEEELEHDDVTEERPAETGESSMESDSEGLVLIGQRSKNKSASVKQADSVTVTIASFSLEEGTSIFTEPSVQMLFVEYRFLNCPPDELETPFSLPKPQNPHMPIVFNFQKIFHVDMERNYEKRQHLASMLLPDHPDDGRICFTVVSEPTEDNQSAECEDIGSAFVSVRDILKSGKNIYEKDIPVFDVRDGKSVIGSLNVTVECLEAMKAVQEELQ
ncbi:protein fantom-like isoform X3 [Lineus longissimus]|uniref:protein fantom-like isoform X3 n=1 Tax=Lineus longissimus TaxID=88925 RepID=UPI002B4C27B4